MRMIRNLLLILITLTTSMIIDAQPVDSHGHLRVEGSQLVNQRGEPYVLRGIGYGRHNWWQHLWNSGTVNWLADDWKLNVIRAAMGIEPEGGYLDNPDFGKQKMRDVVDACIEKGIYVIIDWHAHDLYWGEAKAFFDEMSRDYGGYPNVLYELINEPDYESWPEVKAYAIEMINTIRANDPDNIILVGSPHYSQDLHLVADDPITGYNNIMYTMHFYAGTHWNSLRDRSDYARSKGLGVFVSECAGMNADGDGPINYDNWNTYLTWMESNQISWCKWAMHHKGNSCATIQEWASWSGGWSDGDLTENGIQTKYDLHYYYTEDPPDPPPPPPPPPPTGDVTFNIFPNPTGTDVLVIVENDPVTTPLQLKFYDAAKKLVYEATLESAVSNIPINFPKGVYWVHLQRDDTSLYERVLVL